MVVKKERKRCEKEMKKRRGVERARNVEKERTLMKEWENDSNREKKRKT